MACWDRLDGSLCRMMRLKSHNLTEEIRELGWTLWDPIGLADTMGHWKGQPFEDEYDTYLLEALNMRRQGHSVEEVARFFLWVETVRMETLGDPTCARARVSSLAKALFELPVGQE